MRDGRWWRGLLLALLVTAAVLAAGPAARGPASDPVPPLAGAPPADPSADLPVPPVPAADEGTGETVPPPDPPLPPAPPDSGKLLDAVVPLWEVYQQGVAADEHLLALARKLEAGQLSFWGFALAARRTAAEQQENLRHFSALVSGVPDEARSFSRPARESLEHRLEAARLAERAALTLSEKGYAEAVEQHRMAVAKGVSATINLIALFQRYGRPWPPAK